MSAEHGPLGSFPDDPDLVLPDNAHRSGRIVFGKWKGSTVVVKASLQAQKPVLEERGELWTSCRHANVLQVFGISPSNADPLFLVTPHQSNGNIMGYLKQNPDVDRTKLVFDVVVGMNYLHSRDIVHGSLKPNNILINPDNTASVADYGMIEVQSNSGSPGHRYLSPEGWKGTVSRPSDVFAFAMCALEIFSGTPPWGILSEKQIFRLVVQQDMRPDRPDEQDFGLTDHVWGVLEECWSKVSRLRPTFDIISQLLRTSARIAPLSIPQVAVVRPTEPTPILSPPRGVTGGHSSLPSPDSNEAYVESVLGAGPAPPSYEVASSSAHVLNFSDAGPSAPSTPSPAPDSPGARKRALMNAPYVPMNISTPLSSPQSQTTAIPPAPPRPPLPAYTHQDEASNGGEGQEVDRLSPMFASTLSLTPPETPNTPSWTPERRLTPSASVRTSSSGASSRSHRSSASASGGSGPSRPLPERLGTIHSIGEEPQFNPYNMPEQLRSAPSSLYPHSEYGGGSEPRYPAYAESVRSQPSTVGGTTLNANLLAGALLAEMQSGRKNGAIDELLGKVHVVALRSEKDVQKLVTAGLIPTLISLLKMRAADGVGIEYDPITANTIFRTNTGKTLIEILDSATSDEVAALATWCIARLARSPEVASGLLKQNLAPILVSKGLRGGPLTSRIAAWCIGGVVRNDAIADTLTEGGMVTALCEHLRRVKSSLDTGTEDYSAILYAVARLSRSIKIAKNLARGGAIETLSHILLTGTDGLVLQYAARAVGCLMRPNSGDMARSLLDAGIARGLARLPSVLAPDDLEPLGALAFAVQRFSCAEWGGGVRKSLVEAGVVDSLLAALRTAGHEDCPQVHIEIAYAIALLADVGGSAIKKEILSAGGIDILKQISAAGTVKPEVAKACNLAVTSVTGNVWTRNAASAKAALAHEWSGGCPDYVPQCPLPLDEVVQLDY
ncbi:Protein kinase domain-containing protein [Mycena kentingensis (nom. inval.)]|nr:Protein kinase domain-containing protein [Mycena kentingensis (nom. inval.)]